MRTLLLIFCVFFSINNIVISQSIKNIFEQGNIRSASVCEFSVPLVKFSKYLDICEIKKDRYWAHLNVEYWRNNEFIISGELKNKKPFGYHSRIVAHFYDRNDVFIASLKSKAVAVDGEDLDGNTEISYIKEVYKVNDEVGIDINRNAAYMIVECVRSNDWDYSKNRGFIVVWRGDKKEESISNLTDNSSLRYEYVLWSKECEFDVYRRKPKSLNVCSDWVRIGSINKNLPQIKLELKPGENFFYGVVNKGGNVCKGGFQWVREFPLSFPKDAKYSIRHTEELRTTECDSKYTLDGSIN